MVMEQYPQQYVVTGYPAQYQPQWVEFIVPVLMGLILLVVIASMVRDLIKGEKVELPFS